MLLLNDLIRYLRILNNKISYEIISDPATHLGLASGTDSHWGSYNSSYASYLGQTQPASFNSTTAALSAYGSAVGGANTTGEVGSASSGTAGSGHLLTEHGSTPNQIPTGKDFLQILMKYLSFKVLTAKTTVRTIKSILKGK